MRFIFIVMSITYSTFVSADSSENMINDQLNNAVYESVKKGYGFPHCSDLYEIGLKFRSDIDKNKDPISFKKLAGYNSQKVSLTMQWYLPLWEYVRKLDKSNRDLYQWSRQCEDNLYKKISPKMLQQDNKRNRLIRNISLKEKVDYQYENYLKNK